MNNVRIGTRLGAAFAVLLLMFMKQPRKAVDAGDMAELGKPLQESESSNE